MLERSVDSHYDSKVEISHTLPILQLVHQHHHHHRHYHHLRCYLTGLGFDESSDGVLRYVMNLDAGFPILPHHWKALLWPKIQEICAYSTADNSTLSVHGAKIIPYEFYPFTLSHAKVNDKAERPNKRSQVLEALAVNHNT
jgi:hypothetical protein